MTTNDVYGDLDLLKQSVDPPIMDAQDDAVLTHVLEVASRSIDDECSRFFYQLGSDDIPAELLVVGHDPLELHPGFDIVSISSVDIDLDGDDVYETTWESSGWRLGPLDASLRSRPYRYVEVRGSNRWPTSELATIRLSGVFGWPEVPAAISEATMMLAVRLWKRRGSPLGIAGFGDMGPVYVRNSDPDIARMVAPYKLLAVG